MKDGYSVSTASTLEAAREALLQNNYSLVIADVRLLDQKLGDIGGLELLSSMRDVWEERNRPGIIVITGYATDNIEEMALSKFKANHFIPKNPPEGFDVAHFRNVVKQIMSEIG
jgi:DNA-binding response OmpR family regulator